MAQLKITGKAARVTIAGVTVTASDVTNIDYTIGGETADSSGMGDTYRTFLHTLKTMTFNVSGFTDGNVQASIDAASLLAAVNAARADSDGIVAFSLYPTGASGSSQEITGNCIMTNTQTTYPFDGMAVLTASFQVTGAPTFEASPA